MATAIEVVLTGMLKTDADLLALIDARVYPVKLPQDPTLPAVTYQKISGPRIHDLDVAFPRFQITAWATSYIEAEAVGFAIRGSTQRYKGIRDGVNILQMVFLNEVDMRDPETGYYTRPVDVEIIYEEE